ncbi:MAG: hypothetical protein QMD09_14185, partial [Desulfatibacillaceae bacterium]|nr:hypothetical protein [Desulfatibacillaceae bacterium]
MPKGELFLKLQSEKTANGEEDNTHYLDEKQKWLADAGVEKIEWELWTLAEDASKLVFSVKVKTKDEYWQKGKDEKPWKDVNCFLSGLHREQDEKLRNIVFALFSTENYIKYPVNKDIHKVTTKIKDK